MTLPLTSEATGSEQHDWRLVPAAVTVWGSAIVGLLLGWGWAVVGCLSAVAFATVLLLRPSSAGRWGAGAGLLGCGLLLSLFVLPTLRAAADDQLRAGASRGAAATLTVELRARPKPVFRPGFGGRRSGAVSVVVSARVVQATVAGRAVESTGRVLLTAPADSWSTLLPGQRVAADGDLVEADGGRLTVAVLRVRGPPEPVAAAPVWERMAQPLRAGLRDAAAVLDEEEAGLLPALTVGDTDLLPRQVVDEFTVAGMSHLLAVSGTNLAIVCLAVLLLLRALTFGPRTCAVGALCALVGFVVLVGTEPSVLRAGAMAAVGLAALALGRERAVIPALATAVITLVVIDPELAVSFGFVLSVLATAGLVLLAPRWADALAARGVPRGLAEALAVPAAAHVVTAPVVAGMAGQMSLVSVVANLVVAPVVAPATVLGVIAALLAPWWTTGAELAVRLAGPEVSWLVFVGRQAAGIPGASMSWPTGWGGGILLAGITAVVLVALRRRALRVAIGLGLTVTLVVAIPVVVIEPGWPPPGWSVVACDVGQGDAIVLATGEPERAVVVDTGPQPTAIDDCLDRLGVSSLALVVLSHLHADHVGGLAAVLADRQVAAVAVGPARQPDWAWDEVRDRTARAGVPLVALTAGQRLRWPGLWIEVLSPSARAPLPASEADGTEINDASLVLAADTAVGRVLLTGDIELAAQASLLESGQNLAADVLKVPHHGSRYSLPEFLAAVRPKLALISVGADNRYGHPDRRTIAALDQGASAVARTDTGGDTAVVAGDRAPRAIGRGRSPPGRRQDGRGRTGRPSGGNQSDDPSPTTA